MGNLSVDNLCPQHANFFQNDYECGRTVGRRAGTETGDEECEEAWGGFVKAKRKGAKETQGAQGKDYGFKKSGMEGIGDEGFREEIVTNFGKSIFGIIDQLKSVAFVGDFFYIQSIVLPY